MFSKRLLSAVFLPVEAAAVKVALMTRMTTVVFRIRSCHPLTSNTNNSNRRSKHSSFNKRNTVNRPPPSPLPMANTVVQLAEELQMVKRRQALQEQKQGGCRRFSLHRH
jgi:hypothetical protein